MKESAFLQRLDSIVKCDDVVFVLGISSQCRGRIASQEGTPEARSGELGSLGRSGTWRKHFTMRPHAPETPFPRDAGV